MISLDTWSDVVEHTQRLDPDVFVASVGPDGAPHLSVVTPGYLEEHVVVATWTSSIKVRNIRNEPRVMLHWLVREETNNDMLLVRGMAHIVESSERSHQLWESRCLPYDPSQYYSGPSDPRLKWLEITPSYASLHRNFGTEGSATWQP